MKGKENGKKEKEIGNCASNKQTACDLKKRCRIKNGLLCRKCIKKAKKWNIFHLSSWIFFCFFWWNTNGIAYTSPNEKRPRFSYATTPVQVLCVTSAHPGKPAARLPYQDSERDGRGGEDSAQATTVWGSSSLVRLRLPRYQVGGHTRVTRLRSCREFRLRQVTTPHRCALLCV